MEIRFSLVFYLPIDKVLMDNDITLLKVNKFNNISIEIKILVTKNNLLQELSLKNPMKLTNKSPFLNKIN